MAALKFGDTATFDENWEAFLSALEALDPEMTTILRVNRDRLRNIVRGGTRNTQARSDFNARVLAALEALASAPKSGAP